MRYPQCWRTQMGDTKVLYQLAVARAGHGQRVRWVIGWCVEGGQNLNSPVSMSNKLASWMTCRRVRCTIRIRVHLISPVNLSFAQCVFKLITKKLRKLLIIGLGTQWGLVSRRGLRGILSAWEKDNDTTESRYNATDRVLTTLDYISYNIVPLSTSVDNKRMIPQFVCYKGSYIWLPRVNCKHIVIVVIVTWFGQLGSICWAKTDFDKTAFWNMIYVIILVC